MLSRKICTWDGSQKALDQLSAEGLKVSHFVVCSLLGGMQSSDIDSLIDSLRVNLESSYGSKLSEEEIDKVLETFEEIAKMKKIGSNDEKISVFCKTVQDELKKDNKIEMANALEFVLNRAEGKYGSISFSLWGAKITFCW